MSEAKPMHEQWGEKFWARVEVGDGCWTWTGSRLPKGYGRFCPAWKVGLYAHRVSWEMANGREVPEGLHVMHSCDNPSCVRPDHLSVGTRDDNMQDCVRKGRHVHGTTRGEQHHAHKLTTAQVVEIRKRLALGEKRRALAIEFGVTKVNIKLIDQGKSWRHVAVAADDAGKAA